MTKLDEVRTWIKENRNNNGTALVQWQIKTVDGRSITDKYQPCFGTLSSRHSKKSERIEIFGLPFPDFWDGDLRIPGTVKKQRNLDQDVIDFILDKSESPWRKIMSKLNFEVVKGKSGYEGIILINPDFQAEAVNSFLQALRYSWERTEKWQKNFKTIAKKNSLSTAFFASHYWGDTNKFNVNTYMHGLVLQPVTTSLKEFKNGKFVFNDQTSWFSTHPGHYICSKLWNAIPEQPLYTFFKFEHKHEAGPLYSRFSSLDVFFDQLPQAVREYYAQFKE